METPLFEHVLTMRERGNLPESEYGLPEVKKYPLTDKEHVLKAIQYFGSCPDKQMHILAANINKKIKQFKMNVNVSETNKFYKYYVPYDSTVKENLLVVESVDTTGIEDLVQETSFLLDNTQFNDWREARQLIIKYLRWVNYIISRDNYMTDAEYFAKEDMYIAIFDILQSYLDDTLTLEERVDYLNAIITLLKYSDPVDYKYAYLIANTIKVRHNELGYETNHALNQFVDENLEKMKKYDNDKIVFIYDYDPDVCKDVISKFGDKMVLLTQYYLGNKNPYSVQKYIIEVAYTVYDDIEHKLDVYDSNKNCITNKFNNIQIQTLSELICYPKECDDILDKNNINLNMDELYLDRVSERFNIIKVNLKDTIIPRLPDEIIPDVTPVVALKMEPENNICMLVGIHQNKTLVWVKINTSADGTLQIFAIEPIDIGLGMVDLKEKSLTEGLTINPDGSVRFTLKPNKSYIDEYSEVHKLIVENFNNRNYEAVKDNLCFLFTLIATIEREVLYSKKKINEDVRKDALDARALAINDFKTYLKKLQKVDRNFDFTSYYERSNHGKLVVNITPDTIKGIKKLFNIILLG
nr:MAG TPA: hypothetical protein [Bacteriophage sp.]